MENDMQLTCDCTCSWSLLIIWVCKAQPRIFYFFFCVCSPWWSPYTTCSSRLQPAVHNALSLFSVLLLGARWSIKTIFLMFVLFTPVLEHRWMSTPRRVVATAKIILLKARLYACSNHPPPRPRWCMRCAPLQSGWHSKWLWEHRCALLMRFHQCIIWMSFSYWPLT